MPRAVVDCRCTVQLGSSVAYEAQHLKKLVLSVCAGRELLERKSGNKGRVAWVSELLVSSLVFCA